MDQIQKPISRGKLRQFFGKEYYILRRKFLWLSGKTKWAKSRESEFKGFSVFKHRSKILRALQGVDMQLQENKRTNLRIAISHLDGLVIKPGETFSIWKNVGRPTRKKGYLEGLVLKQGTTASDTGGGLCQLGNLLFWIFGHSPLTVTERYRHGFDVFPDVNRKVPFGAGATLSYNHVDLQVRNDTDQDFCIKLWLDKTHLNGELLGLKIPDKTYELEERNHVMKQQSWGGYSRHNQIFKIETLPDGSSTELLLVENHAVMMYNPFLGS